MPCFFLLFFSNQCQTWTLLESHKRKITSCEMRCIRNATNKTRRDRIQNETLRNIVGTIPVNDYIEQQRIKWFGHLNRMKPDQPAARAYCMKTSGYKARGRPRKRWIDEIKETLNKFNMTPAQATQLVISRKLHIPPLCNASRHKQ